MSSSDSVQRMTIEWTRAQPSVGRFVNSFLRDRAEAADVLQEIALVIVEKFDQWDPKRPFVGWAPGIARRVVLAHLREKYRDPRCSIDLVVRKCSYGMGLNAILAQANCPEYE